MCGMKTQVKHLGDKGPGQGSRECIEEQAQYSVYMCAKASETLKSPNLIMPSVFNPHHGKQTETKAKPNLKINLQGLRSRTHHSFIGLKHTSQFSHP